jgi:hypothetical protein
MNPHLRCQRCIRLDTTRRGAREGQVGGDFCIGPGTQSVDAIYDFNRYAMALSLGGPLTPH